MKTTKLLLLFFVLVTATSLIKAQPAGPIEKQWVPVSELTDEFSGSILDGSKWLNTISFWEGRFPSKFKKENVSVSGGFLKLKSTVANEQQQGAWVNAAAVMSKTKAMKPGYYSEARIKCPTLSMTGAYWFQGAYSEIDVIENFGAPTAPVYAGHETHMKTNLHYFKDGWANDKATPWEAAILKPACDEAYFNYGVWWKDSATVVFYLDGKEVHTSKAGGAFKENMYLFFDMETFDWGIGLPTVESLQDSTKNTQYVDWVHTWKLNYKPESVPVTGVSLNSDTLFFEKTGTTQTLTPTIIPGNATNQNVSWISDNTKVATVTANGVVKAISEGTATITCTTQDASKKATCTIRVGLKTGMIMYPASQKYRLNIFPNPVTETDFNVQIVGYKSYTIKISNLNGQSFFQKKSSEELTAISRNIFPSKGIYLIHVYSNDFSFTQKIYSN